ncbi:capsule biosynthesis protein [Polymorphum gilvum]|uniref:Capsular polysaccharide biosynthesis/export protein n=1 Tax=Polymorphum gilvum (strain LMG 25793 / CGMCC 1.9160 / SL003B-26A1) TaxID=991905 RepID=F2J3D9_POLGS|nr:capsular biosynthesis protein [Polymorphum gilvum]ADZ70964.1 Capsular polysaccharide biosynthesis/export protein [Polymorphum gilvum SL003B-26A1]
MAEAGTGSERVFVFLQGPPSIFARTLADELELLGHRTLRVNLCPGDWLDWHDRRCTSYRGSLAGFPAWLEGFLRRVGASDLVYYADRQPYHVAAAEVAGRLGIACAAYEFGYLRPDWITPERNGMSAHSLFPDDPALILSAAAGLPAIDRRPLYPYAFWREAAAEVVYNLANVLLAPLAYRRYVRDKFYHPLAEYLRMAPRLALARWRDTNAEHLIDDLIGTGLPYYVFPLQLQSDYQLRYNAPYDHIGEAAEEVIRSFAKAAPVSARLVFKIHPLDQGIEPWRRLLKGIARRYGVRKRIYVIDGGNLNRLLEHAKGALTINSTTGIHALRVGCPTKVLGIALYDIAGLTSQGPLDAFWSDRTRPDPQLLEALERLLAASIQVKGNFYTERGRRAGARAMALRLAAGTLNQPGARVDPPPRLERARAQNIPTTFADQLATRGKTERWSRAWTRTRPTAAGRTETRA